MSENREKNNSTEAYKGVRDFYPEDMFIQNYLFGVWKKTVESFGYIEYNASILEPTELYKSKSGEEIVNEQTYSFTDRGDREVTLRPEMTPTVARMVAAKRRELSFPVRWYSIPNLFRYERPQRGRLREHWQLNADLFGVSSIDAEVEAISMAQALLTNFSLDPKNFLIKINYQGLLSNFLASHFTLTQEKIHRTIKLLDRKNKMEKAAFNESLENIIGLDNRNEFNRLLEHNLLESQVREMPEYVYCMDLKARLSALGINVEINLLQTRGFDYYTGIVFEVFDTDKNNNRSIFGGGRYDDLLSIFGVEPIPTVGFGIGDVVIRDVLETYGLLPTYIPTTDLYIASLNDTYHEAASELASTLRKEGLNVAVDYSGRKVSDQVKKAVKEKIPFFICIGQDEFDSKTYKVKTLAEEEETPVTEAEIATFIAYRKTHKIKKDATE